MNIYKTQNIKGIIQRDRMRFFAMQKIDFFRKVINPKKCAKTLMIKSVRKYPKVGRATICHKPTYH